MTLHNPKPECFNVETKENGTIVVSPNTKMLEKHYGELKTFSGLAGADLDADLMAALRITFENRVDSAVERLTKPRVVIDLSSIVIGTKFLPSLAFAEKRFEAVFVISEASKDSLISNARLDRQMHFVDSQQHAFKQLASQSAASNNR